MVLSWDISWDVKFQANSTNPQSRKVAFMNSPNRKHWFHELYDHRNYDVSDGKSSDTVYAANAHTRHRSDRGKRYRIITHVLAVTNLLTLAIYLWQTFLPTQTSDGTPTALGQILSTTAMIGFMLSAVLMMTFYALARSHHEFLNSEEDDIEADGALTQTWVYFGGSIFALMVLVKVIIWLK